MEDKNNESPILSAETVESFNPRPREINIAGSSKTPCGKILQREKTPPSETLKFETIPKMSPFNEALKKGKIPNRKPKKRPIKLERELFPSKKKIISTTPYPSVSFTRSIR